MSRLTRYGIGLGTTACLVGCTVGPDYSTPQMEVPSAFSTTLDASAHSIVSPDIVDTEWWHALGDPVLSDLIDEAMEHNRSVASAVARVRESRALARAAGARDRPAVGGTGFYERRRASENGIIDLESIPGASLENDLFQGGFDASWEIDLFGGARRTVEDAVARYQATIEDRRALTLSVIAEVAATYAEYRGAQSRRAVLRDNIRIQSESRDRVESNVKVGFAGALDLARAEAQLAQTRALEPGLTSAVRVAAFRLAVLVGRTPGEIDVLLEGAGEQALGVPDVIPVGLPSELIRRRPDVRGSERRLAAATAEIGVNTAELYPRVSLTGAFAMQSTSIGDVVDIGSRTWRIGPSVRWRLFEGGRLRSLVDAAEARQEAAAADFEQAVLLALEEVEASLTVHAAEIDRRLDLRHSVAQSRRAYDAAVSLYQDGLEDAFFVLDAERDLAERTQLLAESEQAVLVSLVAVYKALGGGWEPYDASFEHREAGAPDRDLPTQDVGGGRAARSQ